MKKFLLWLIKFYKKYVSSYFQRKNIHCKYYPTCSDYSYQAIEKYGVIKRLYLTIIRLLKCNPFSKGGYDPLK